jgi:hypothetical protein
MEMVVVVEWKARNQLESGKCSLTGSFWLCILAKSYMQSLDSEAGDWMKLQMYCCRLEGDAK